MLVITNDRKLKLIKSNDGCEAVTGPREAINPMHAIIIYTRRLEKTNTKKAITASCWANKCCKKHLN